MNHLSEEELILHYYGEAGESLPIEEHLSTCETCGALYRALEHTLNGMNSLPVPERGEGYGAQVWERIEHSLPARTGFRLMAAPWRWAAAGMAIAAMLVLAFLAGRSYPVAQRPVQTASGATSRNRILLVAVGDHLERSQMVLTELSNASSTGPLDISFEQERATDLLGENRLYRQTALRTGNTAMAGVLDELERVLLEVSHAPSQISPEELDELRLRLKAEGILFKLRVLGSNVRNEEEPAARQPL